jgi:hypothetical protein
MNSIADQLAQQGQLIQRLSAQLQQQQVTCSSAMATSPADLLEVSVLPHYEWHPNPILLQRIPFHSKSFISSSSSC